MGWMEALCLSQSVEVLPSPSSLPAVFCWELRQAGKERISKSAACSPEQRGAMESGVGGSSRVHGGPQAAFPWEAGYCVWTGVGRWSCPLLPQPSPISKEHPWSWRRAVPTPLDGLPSPQL